MKYEKRDMKGSNKQITFHTFCIAKFDHVLANADCGLQWKSVGARFVAISPSSYIFLTSSWFSKNDSLPFSLSERHHF